MKIYGVIGWKNSGKTTLMERMVAEIAARGISISTIKHAHHAFDVDHPGKDSWRHRQAGARQVLLTSRKRWALMNEMRNEAEPTLAEFLPLMSPVDLVLIEGYKRDAHPKIEAYRRGTGAELIAQGDPTVRAVAADGPLTGLSIPVLNLNDPASVVDFILAECGLSASGAANV